MYGQTATPQNAVLVLLRPNLGDAQMNFIEWIKHQEPEGPTLAAANQRLTRITRDRNRLTRIELMVRELIEREDSHAENN
jgi:hypothetical protein